MSNIYIQEPPTHGKVLLETSVGDIDIELWSREAPKACRNFVQLCLEGYYDGTIFHRVVKGFIVQGGDPTGTGHGGDSVYGKPFKDEFHTRLRFVRRGLVAMANAGRDDNGSQFFFTMGPASELQNKHTIFGKVTGNTVFNMLKLEDGLVDSEDRPLYPHNVKKTVVLSNPFKDIEPRTVKHRNAASASRSEDEEAKTKDKGTKNFKLLSFGDEAEEDEEETNVVAKEYRGKSKSSHDLANDPRLSSVPAVQQPEEEEERSSGKRKNESQDEDAELKSKKRLDDVKNKLRAKASEIQDPKDKKEANQTSLPVEDEDDNVGDDDPSNSDNEKRKKMEEIRKEVRELKRELKGVKKSKAEEQEPEVDEDLDPAVEEYKNVMKQYEDKKTKSVKKGGTEQKTLELLEKFKAQLSSAKDEEEEELEDDESDAGWLNHRLEFESDERLAKDANIKNEDTFEIYDPRNPINQRRREASKAALKEKAKKR